ncbi:hypothetical protein VHUM_03490 [Vanrija humicola]|uniref:Uncharacterized protein n=1 Tax=Vanrija humicola TaxID=5417 RepID=A0A7D8YXL6_VANHU|nr:hypothetical protein VHUM_03490 [Vanrija humicola]
MSDKYKVGIIYPPQEMRKMIDKTATAVSKTSKPQALEDKIKESQKTDPRFAFLNDEDPYHQYYRYMVEIKREEAEDIAKGITPASGTPGAATPAVAPEPKDEGPVYEPKPLEFKVDLPGVTAQDLDILRLTALFHARRGRSFLEALSVREGRNYQFDFLRPTHSMFGYYNRMVESYQKIMHPPPGMIASVVEANADPEAKWKTLEEGRLRAEWERARRKKEDQKAKEKDEEAQVFAEIDWQDFVTVETIEFTQADMELDLPPPTNVDKLRVMSMAEKRMAAMIMEEPGAGAAAPGGDNVEEVDMEEDEDDEEARLQRIKEEKELARARDVQRAALESKGLKIKKDYVAKGIQRGGNVATAKCPYCGQSIPESELSEHIRIELLDPRWKDQKRDLEQRRQQQQQLQIGADISKSLKDLAANRTDLFGDESDEAAKARREAEAEQKRKDREKIVWDGHTNSAKTAETTFQARYSAEDAARRRNEAMGLSDKPINTVGPQVGPGIQAQAQQPIMKAPPSASTGTTISAAPTGPSAGGQPTYYSAQQQAGQVRPAPDDGGADRAFKRQRVAKLPGGQLYSEIDWMSLHPEPISLSVQLPTMPDKPEWKLDGSIITVSDLPVNTLFSTLRERIKRTLDADLPISRLRIDYNGKVMSNGASLASVNLDDGDTVVMGVRKK